MRSIAILGAGVVLLVTANPGAAGDVRLRPLAPVTVDANGAPLSRPEGVACRDRTVVIADTGNGRLLGFRIDGDVMTPDAPISLPEVPRPTRVALNSKGEIFAVDAKLRRVARLSAAGEFRGYVDLDEGRAGFSVAPQAIAIDRDDGLYVLDSYAEKVKVLTGDGSLSRTIAFPRSYRFLADLAVDRAGTVYAIDSVSKAIFRAGKTDDTLVAFDAALPEDLEFPAGIAVDAGGHLFVSDPSGSIVVLGNDGKFGSRQSSLGWRPGRLLRPTALCTNDHGDLFVADRGNNRVQVFAVVQ